MKYFCGVTHLKYSWDQVAQAFWTRYPNPYSKHVLSEDTVVQHIEGQCLHSLRLVTKTNKMPKWGERIVPGPRYVSIVEESVVDPKLKTLTTYTKNIGYTRLLNVDEKCIYSQSASDKNVTVCERQAWISSNVFGLSYPIQAFAFERYKKNILKAVAGFEHVLRERWPDVKSTEAENRSVPPCPAPRQTTTHSATSRRVPVLPPCTGKGTT